MTQSYRNSTIFLATLLITLGILGASSYYFLGQMNENSILTSSGAGVQSRILNNYKYTQNRKAFIYSSTFFVAGILLFTMIMLPAKENAVVTRKPGSPPQPVYKEGGSESRIAEVVEEEADRIDQPEEMPDEVKPVEKIPDKQFVNANELSANDVTPSSSIPIIEGETDVIYGSGRITDEATLEFVNKYSDSAIKFLYRRDLDGKPVSRDEEDIYASWERRGMARGKVKKMILSIMDWEELPQVALHQLWKYLRDQIFELK
jgi:hypothetical protein